MFWSPLSQCIIKAFKEGDHKKVEELFKIGWDKIEQRHRWQCRKTLFYIGYMDFGMKWGIILFGKTIYMKETNWRDKYRGKI